MKTIDLSFEDKSYDIVYTLTVMEKTTLFDVLVKDLDLAKYVGSEFTFTITNKDLILTPEIEGATAQRLKQDIIARILSNEDIVSTYPEFRTS